MAAPDFLLGRTSYSKFSSAVTQSAVCVLAARWRGLAGADCRLCRLLWLCRFFVGMPPPGLSSVALEIPTT